MVYQVNESATFNRRMASLADQRAQRRCEEAFGHILKVVENRIFCEECGAEWKVREPGK
jgi:hypothetical protein